MLGWQQVRNHGRLKRWPSAIAFRALNSPPVGRIAARRYERDLLRHRTELPTLPSLDALVVEGLERHGVYVTTLEALCVDGSADMVDYADRLATEFAGEAHGRSDEGQTYTVVPPVEASTPEIFNWGLQDRLLDIVEAYLRLPVAYDGLNIIYTVADGREIATRQWHRDREDRRMVKIAVYLNDVDADGGPFELFGVPDERQNDAEGFRYVEADDAHFRAMYGEDYVRYVTSCVGAKGTVVFADTARFFHRGAPATARDRSAVFFSYFARRPRHPFYCERSGLTRDQLEAIAAELPARQRDAVLWRRFLPLPLRLIPPAPL